MRRNLSVLVLFACIAPFGLAQKAPPAAASPCPRVEVTSPDLAKAGDGIKITASVTGGDKDVTPTYSWTVSDGAIESGQGTSTITVDTSGVESGFITATVEVGGYSGECATTSSSTTTIEAKAKDEKKPPVTDTRELAPQSR